MNYKLKYQDDLPKPVDELADTARMFHILSREAEGLYIDKNNFYRNSFSRYGLSGIVVRLYDKFQALQSAFKEPTSSTESITEILLDISNYAILGAILQFFGNSQGCNQHLFKEDDSGEEFFCIICGAKL